MPFLTLLVASLMLTSGATQSVRLDLYDESMYLSAAAGFSGVLPDWSPLYVKYLSSYFHFITDPTQVYYLNIRVLSMALPLLAYALARSLNASRLSATAAAFLLLISTTNMPLTPKTHHFAVVVVFLLLFLLNQFRVGRTGMFATFFIASIFLIYVRPEQMLSVSVFFVLFLWSLLRRGGRFWAPLLECLAVAAASLTVVSFDVGGLPLGSRAPGAFVQSFAMGMNQRLPSGDPLRTLSTEELYRKFFGDPSGGLTGAILRNPTACVGHWIWTFRRFCIHLGPLFLGHYMMADWAPGLKWVDQISFGVLYLMLILLAAAGAARHDGEARAWMQERWRTTAVCLAVFCAPCLLMSLLYCPWDRYLSPIMFSSVLLLAPFFSREGERALVKKRIFPILFCLDLLLITPRQLTYASPVEGGELFKSTILIRSGFLDLKARDHAEEPASCLIDPTFFAVHLGCKMNLSINAPELWDKPQDFLAYVSRNKPRYVIRLVNRWSHEEMTKETTKQIVIALERKYRYWPYIFGTPEGDILGYVWARQPERAAPPRRH